MDNILDFYCLTQNRTKTNQSFKNWIIYHILDQDWSKYWQIILNLIPIANSRFKYRPSLQYKKFLTF